MGILRTFVDGVFNGQRFKPNQFVAFFDLRAVFDDPDDRVVSPNATFDLGVFGTFQDALLNNADDKITSRNGIGQGGGLVGGGARDC